MEEGQQNKRARAEEAEETKGTNVVILVDESGSMEAQEKTVLPAVAEALRALCRTVPTPNELSVKIFCFSDELRLACDNSLGALAEMGLTDVAYSPHGTTALYDALIGGLEHCARSATLLVATDGENTSGRYTRESARKALRTAQEGRGVKVMWLAEGSAAMREGQSLGLPVMMREPHVSLSQAMADPSVHAQLSQSVAFE
jgi:uncharacterized protein with von Willebrand factor type A (vWA) domain